jgi:type II secretory pathway pseudopilin PulG
MNTRRAMTMVEILVVITVIVLLIGLLMPAVGILLDRSRQAKTMRLLNEINGAVITYMNENGDLPAAFDTAMAVYLGDPLASGAVPLMELAEEQRDTSNRVLDGYGSPILVEITRATVLGKANTITKVRIVSEGRKLSVLGSTTLKIDDATKNKDDLRFDYDPTKESRFVRKIN